MDQARPFCSELARESAEPLFATASRIDHWLLIEYRGLWSFDALAGSGLSDQVKDHLREQVAALPRARLLFVRRPERRRSPGLLAYSAVSRESAERLRAIEFEDYEDLRELDFSTEFGRTVEHPLFVVCTHGKHDPCCARHGRPLYEALVDELDEDWVWQSTHVGGDRFAGNLVCLPHGLYYGRVERKTVPALVDDHLRGRIDLAHYRGRSCYPFHVQAAELALRDEAGLMGFSVGRLVASERQGDSWTVTFATDRGEYDMTVEAYAGDFTTLTCHAQAPKRPTRYVVSALTRRG